MKRLRLALQLAIVVIAAVAGARFAMGRSLVSVETYCPFGGLETAYAFLTRQRFTCAAGDTNLALFVALLGLTFLARKAFCGWVCPVGALSEWEGRLAQRLFRRGDFAGLWRVSPRADRALRTVLRTVVLALVLVATWTTGELVFRGYDPYYILFSANGHDVRAVSYTILGALAMLGLLLPMAWCRYLCPLGAAIWPLSAAGRLRLSRADDSCTACGACDRACPQVIDVSQAATVKSGECTLCFECTEVCPSGALELCWGGKR